MMDMSGVVTSVLASIAWLSIGTAYAIRQDRTFDADTDEGERARQELDGTPIPPVVVRRIVMALTVVCCWPWLLYCDLYAAAAWLWDRRRVEKKGADL